MPRLFAVLYLALALVLFAFGCNLNERDNIDKPNPSDSEGGVKLDSGVARDSAAGPADGRSSNRDARATAADAAKIEDADDKDVIEPDASETLECEPELIDCINHELCGPVIDHCSGTVYQCGGCSDGLVCDLAEHRCVVPRITCEDLGAECGRTKNSCGERLDCGGCPDGEECDPDTNTCVPCDTSVTCSDLGYECGEAWLGCGPKTNKTDCGECEEGGCNETFYVCEPECTPELSDQEICEAAGAECGTVSNGCQGLADCGECPEGLGCGIMGVANRCSEEEPAVECIAANRECGILTSVCGDSIDCGECPEGQICRDNGTCGPPCEPNTCADDYTDQCGSQLDDGCEGVLNCTCPADFTCDTTNPGEVGACVKAKTCADYADANGDGNWGEAGDICSNGASPDFPNDIGGHLSCPCDSGLVCVDNKVVVSSADTGTCCQPSVCPNPADRTTVPCQIVDVCTDATRNCCRSSEHCENGFCRPNLTCEDHEEYRGLNDVWGGENAVCSNDFAVDPFYRYIGDTRGLECECRGDDLYCIDESEHIVSGRNNTGTCCLNNAECGDGPTYPAGCSVANECTWDGQPAEFCCGLNTCCALPDGTPDEVNGTICKPEDTCDTLDPPATGEVGAPCSRGSVFDDGCDGTLLCPCDSGLLCVTEGRLVTTSEQGICCRPNTCANTDWNPDCTVPNGCIASQTISCCAASEYCADPETKSCAPLRLCSYYGANGDVGDECSIAESERFPRGDGSNNTCICLTTAERVDNHCVLQPSQTWGYCVCEPTTCDYNVDCRDHGRTDRCGGTMNCPCPGTQECSNYDGQCYEPRDCDFYDADGELGDACYDGTHPTLLRLPDGNTDPSNRLNCPCDLPEGWENTECEFDDQENQSTCVCHPEESCGGKTGQVPDGCGGFVPGCES
ncbi:MAG: hypothetical protein JXA30_14480 [Deltaproteobacteria bacterium]|nr:hypothetical protein [Deltaproteobacteria bacterium]